MADLKMPELNSVIVAGNLTKDPVFRETSNRTPVVNFHIAVNRRYKDSSNQWQEDVCYVGVVAWNKLADSCRDRLKKGSAVLIDGELQSRTFKTDEGKNRTIVEIKAKRIQFLNKFNKSDENDDDSNSYNDDDSDNSYQDNSFDKFLTDEESDLINDDDKKE
ncbi:MAG: single-stranded DNA-binding protein [Melioribacteraceae bacterium]|nr:single-stranded DNA-binding protein [Melioribacteraceae bacterium]MCF8354953.1 single-stranded DNA-binding protein [Melioribacteraceae bacterium]MCF8392358.1 single-stranded DNA-binding protein [Melioribacteraceae bacterium]MCF8417878.1 single-stranded DNA-binding protein [Melioribacteraceae bacterium]